MKHYEELLNDLITKGGAIICSNDADHLEIDFAKSEKRFAVFPELKTDDFSFGLIRRPKEWLANIQSLFKSKKDKATEETLRFQKDLCSFEFKKLLTMYKNAVRHCDNNPAVNGIEQWEDALNDYKDIYLQITSYVGHLERSFRHNDEPNIPESKTESINSEETEITTCPRRMNEAGPWEYSKNLDRWEIRSGNQLRTCSFCGSLHPQDFLKVINMILNKETGYYIDWTTKSYKYYAHTPGQVYKFYTMHLKKDVDGVNDRFLDELNAKFKEAMPLSNAIIAENNLMSIPEKQEVTD